MKVVYPKNIKRGLLAGLTFNIGPFSVSVIQLFVLAVGVSAALGIFNVMAKSGSKFLGILLAIIVFIIFLIIGFFKISELTLIPFIAKLLRNGFFDVRKKYQINYGKINPIDLLLKKAKSQEVKKIIEQKNSNFDKKHLTDIEKKGLI